MSLKNTHPGARVKGVIGLGNFLQAARGMPPNLNNVGMTEFAEILDLPNS